jgi:hypothetical protein
MKATAVVRGKVVSFELSRGLALAHRRNAGRTLSDEEAIRFVEAKRKAHAKKRMSAYIEDRP